MTAPLERCTASRRLGPLAAVALTAALLSACTQDVEAAASLPDQVQVTGCVAAKNLKLRSINARLPRVYLGSLAGQLGR